MSKAKRTDKTAHSDASVATLTSVDPMLDPQAVFARGFITKAEAKAVDFSKFYCKVNLDTAGKDVEGIWAALITKEDRARYDSASSRNEAIRVVLFNHALCFHPNPSWGRVIEGKTNGGSRPVFHREDQVERFKATHATYLKEYPLKQEDKKGE